jgi:DUF1680 family protein
MFARVIAVVVGIVGSVAAGGLFAADPVVDRETPIRPAQVHFSGWLGHRLEANWKNRLATVNLDERLRPFAHPAESGGWSGEHIGKWLHAAALTWSYTHDPALRARIEEAVATLARDQAPDGYLGTYAPERRWGGWDVWTQKYNLIGLLACHEILGTPRALDVARRIGDLLCKTFGVGRRDIIRSGTHVGMAATSVLEPMVLLYRATGEARYLEFANYIVQAYDQPNGPKIVAALGETRSVARTANRKAYEMLSNLVGLCELYRSTDDDGLLRPCLYAYEDIVANQMYITGGVSDGEYFQEPHHLPNTGHVSENCAQVTWMQLAIQLLRLTGESRYADTVERIAYNHLLAAQKPDGTALCYFTPLAGQKPYTAAMNCCTSSGPRGIALLATVAYATSATSLMVNLYEASTLEATVADVKIKVVEQTRYPLDGTVELAFQPAGPVEFNLLLRIPSWCGSWKVSLNGSPLPATAVPGTYFRITRTWNRGDRVRLELAMPARLVEGHYSNEGYVAVERGPLVLAVDQRLNPEFSIARVAPPAADDGCLALEPAADPQKLAAHVFRGKGLSAVVENDRTVFQQVPLVWTSFAEAGQTGSSLLVWLPSKSRLERAPRLPFLFAKESYSRPGNVDGSIADGDRSTYRTTSDGRMRLEDWFAVQCERPATINAVVFAHGRVFHDGGWWDTARGKPRVQILMAADGAWEDVGVLETYPLTDATTRPKIPDGKCFSVRFPTAKVVGIRIVGAPACGDNPQQSFASCAELQGLNQSDSKDPADVLP